MRKEDDFVLRILGGMGPMAGVEFQKRIIEKMPARGDNDHIKMICFTNPKIKDRSTSLKSGVDFSDEIVKSLNLLNLFGVNIGVITCNTAHASFEKINSQVKFPLLNIIEATVDFLLKKFTAVGAVGLLATDGTIQSGLYGDLLSKNKIDLIIPSKKSQEQLMSIIYGKSGIKSGCINSNKIKLKKIIKELEEDGADVIILGCTELSLLGIEGKFLIDPLDVVADLVVEKKIK